MSRVRLQFNIKESRLVIVRNDIGARHRSHTFHPLQPANPWGFEVLSFEDCVSTQ